MSDDLARRGISSVVSRYAVAESAERVVAALRARGLTVFAVIDQSLEAEKAGLTLRPTRMILFGDPKTGTPLMAAAPSLAIDLPLKALVWQDDGGCVLVSYNSPEYLQRRHGLSHEPFTATGAILAQALA
jgi:uncharacterized protein (DUF302 family)